MTHLPARLLLGTSLSLLIVVIGWSFASSAETPRSDLVGAESPQPEAAATVPVPEVTAEPAAHSALRVEGADPVRLEIPALGVDAQVVAVGRKPNGSMELPGATRAGWYRPGAKPGELFGSAVIAAHVDFNDVRGVFFDLRKLETGSEIVVTDADDQRIRYIATKRFQVDKDDLQIPELFRTNGDHVLTLITCGGAFNTGESKYLDNIVIRAEPVTAS